MNKHKNQITLFLFLLTIMGASKDLLANKKPHKNLVSSNTKSSAWKIFSYLNEPFSLEKKDQVQGHEGLGIELITQLFKRAEMPISIAIELPALGKIKTRTEGHRAFFPIYKTQAFKPIYKWVGPFMKDKWIVLAHRKRKKRIKKFDHLRKYKIGLVGFSSPYIYLKNRYVELKPTMTEKENIDALLKRKIDLWVTSSWRYEYLSKKLNLEDFVQVYTILEQDIYMAISPNTPKLIHQKLNTELVKFKKGEEWNSLIKQYVNPTP